VQGLVLWPTAYTYITYIHYCYTVSVLPDRKSSRLSGDSCAYEDGSPDSHNNSDMSEVGDDGEFVNGEYVVGYVQCLE
jgi:hypothetical protein